MSPDPRSPTPAILVIDESSTIVSANDAIEGLLGFRRQDLVGRPLIGLMPQEMRPRHLSGLRAYLDSGRRTLTWDGIPLQARHRDGRTVDVEVSFVEFKGERRLFCGLIREAPVTSSPLVSIVESAIDASFRVDGTARIIVGNDEAARLFLRNREKLAGQDILELLPFLRSRWDDLVASLTDQPAVRIHGLLHPAPGHLVPCEATIQCVDEAPPGTYLVTVRDLSQLKRNEEERDLRYQQLFQRMGDGVLIFSLDGELLDANVKTQELLALDWADMATRRISDVLAPEAAARTLDKLRSLDADGDVIQFETTFLRGDTRFPADVSCSRLELGGRAVVQILIRDITQRRQLESQLRHATKMEALGTLAGGLAHDFNNLLTVILGQSEELELRSGDSSVAAAAREIRRAAEQAGEMTSQLLALGRRQTARPRRIDLSMAVRETAPMLRSLLGEGVRLHLDLGRSGTVFFDAGQLTQILVNLVANARDATGGRGHVRVTTRTSTSPPPTAADPAARWAVVEVTDDGSGMDETTMARVFDPFFTTKRPGEGTGLGLATVYGIVTQAGGGITVNSKIGQGTRFCVSLPIVAGSLDDETSSHLRRPAPRGRGRVLVVEDDPTVRGVMVRALDNAGFDVQESSDGAGALKFLDSGSRLPDVLVTDTVMPEIDGADLALHLWRIADVPVLLVSGYAPVARVKRVLADPRARFLAKPFRVSELVTSVQQIIDASRSRAMDGDEQGAET